jgi:hypothetical protein
MVDPDRYSLRIALQTSKQTVVPLAFHVPASQPLRLPSGCLLYRFPSRPILAGAECGADAPKSI